MCSSDLAVLLFRHPAEDGTPLLSIAVIHRRANKVDATRDVIEGKVSIIKDIDLAHPHAAHLRILESMALTEVDAKYVPSSFAALYAAWLKALDVKELNRQFVKNRTASARQRWQLLQRDFAKPVFCHPQYRDDGRGRRRQQAAGLARGRRSQAHE